MSPPISLAAHLREASPSAPDQPVSKHRLVPASTSCLCVTGSMTALSGVKPQMLFPSVLGSLGTLRSTDPWNHNPASLSWGESGERDIVLFLDKVPIENQPKPNQSTNAFIPFGCFSFSNLPYSCPYCPALPLCTS